MNENSNSEILITIIILSVLLAILSVTTAFFHTERSAGYKNKVNIGKKNHIIIYPIFFVLHMTAILLFNLPFPDLTCYLSFSIGSIVFIFWFKLLLLILQCLKSLNAIRVQRSENQLFFRWFQHRSTVSFLVLLLHSFSRTVSAFLFLW